MKKFLFLIVFALMASNAIAADIGIASGNTTGTNYAMVEDIKRVCSVPSSNINNVQSDGALDNVFKIYGDKSTQYGIVTADTLVYQKGLDAKMMEKIQMVFPFFSSEMHLIVRNDSKIQSFNDLAGKIVVEGPEGSGTWVSVQVIKSLTGANWRTSILTQKDGMAALLAGQVDAMWIAAGKPVDIITKTQGIRLVGVNHPGLDKFALYTKTMLPTNTYPFQKSAVMTYKVDNILATFAFKNQYQKEISDLVTCITRNLGTLQSTGHAKWRDVNPLDIERIQWQSHPAAVGAIKREMRK